MLTWQMLSKFVSYTYVCTYSEKNCPILCALITVEFPRCGINVLQLIKGDVFSLRGSFRTHLLLVHVRSCLCVNCYIVWGCVMLSVHVHIGA